MAEAGADRKAWKGHERLYAEFCQKVEDLTKTENWLDWLNYQRSFWQYSFSNSMLIQMQLKHASFVGSAKFWEHKGRTIKPFSRPIWIWVPITKPIDRPESTSVSEDQTEDQSSPKRLDRRLAYFLMAKVYDQSQTEGQALPEVAHPLAGVAPQGLRTALINYADNLDFAVTFVAPRELGVANGDCHHQSKLIRISNDLSPAMTIKTLAHEIGHALLHESVDGYRADRGLMELEAESVAYLTLGAFGIPSDKWSLGYVASWASGGGRISGEAIQKRMRHQARRIQNASREITKAIEQELRLSAPAAAAISAPEAIEEDLALAIS